MPKFSKKTLESHDYGPVLDHQAEVDGYTVNITSFNHDIDATPLMKGLPDDRCDCPHWGYVVKGKLTFRYADHATSLSRRPAPSTSSSAPARRWRRSRRTCSATCGRCRAPEPQRQNATSSRTTPTGSS